MWDRGCRRTLLQFSKTSRLHLMAWSLEPRQRLDNPCALVSISSPEASRALRIDEIPTEALCDMFIAAADVKTAPTASAPFAFHPQFGIGHCP